MHSKKMNIFDDRGITHPDIRTNWNPIRVLLLLLLIVVLRLGYVGRRKIFQREAF